MSCLQTHCFVDYSVGTNDDYKEPKVKTGQLFTNGVVSRRRADKEKLKLDEIEFTAYRAALHTATH